MDVNLTQAFLDELERVRRRKNDEEKFRLSGGLKTEYPGIIYLVRQGPSKVLLETGYTVHILEFLAEQSPGYITNLMKVFGFHDYRGTLMTALDFLHLFSWWDPPSYAHLNELEELSYEEILERGEDGFRFTSGEISEACKLLTALFYINSFNRERPKEPPIFDTLEPLDVVRVALYQSEHKFSTLSQLAYNRFTHPWWGEPIDEEEKYEDPLTPYVVGYRGVMGVDPDEIRTELSPYLIPPLAALVVEYLYTSVLFSRAKKLGMIFSPQVITEPQRYRYYFDNIRSYRPEDVGDPTIIL